MSTTEQSRQRRTVARGHAKAELWAGTQGNKIRMVGVIREANVEPWLAPLFAEIHRVAVLTNLARVELDIRALEYANSAFWRCLVAWIKRIQQSPRSYDLHIRSSAARSWQQIALPALMVFAIDPSGHERVFVDGGIA